MKEVRSELSRKNKYWIERYRYYELKYFCLQYPIWKKEYDLLDGFLGRTMDQIYSRLNKPSDPTSATAEKRTLYLSRIDAIEQAAIDADPYLASYILKAVTEGLSYNYLKSRLEIPCGRDMYYDRYRRFFWLLDKIRE